MLPWAPRYPQNVGQLRMERNTKAWLSFAFARRETGGVARRMIVAPQTRRPASPSLRKRAAPVPRLANGRGAPRHLKGGAHELRSRLRTERARALRRAGGGASRAGAEPAKRLALGGRRRRRDRSDRQRQRQLRRDRHAPGAGDRHPPAALRRRLWNGHAPEVRGRLRAQRRLGAARDLHLAGRGRKPGAARRHRTLEPVFAVLGLQEPRPRPRIPSLCAGQHQGRVAVRRGDPASPSSIASTRSSRRRSRT